MKQGWLSKIRNVWAAMQDDRRLRRRARAGLDAADLARRQSDWNTAVSTYSRYLQRHPRDFGVQTRLISTLSAAGRINEAEGVLRRLMRNRPDRADLTATMQRLISAQGSSFPLERYDEFCRTFSIPPAPTSLIRPRDVTVLVDARDASQALVVQTLQSLRQAGVSSTRVVLWVNETSAACGISKDDEHIILEKWADVVLELATARTALVLDAGTAIDSRCLEWLAFALAATGAKAAYGDDDRAVLTRDGVTLRSDPAFHPAADLLDLATTPRVPAVVMFAGFPPDVLNRPPNRRTWLSQALARGSVAHVPLLLATDFRPTTDLVASPNAVGREDGSPERVRVVIPTRDEGEALSVMIESLEATASRPSLLEIVVVDNGSRDPQTLAFLKRMTSQGRIQILVVDEPFNWSRLNNLAAAGAGADILVFANNDMQMLTPDWDDRVRAHLQQPGVGVVGARLLYPNGLLQHGGMALGALDGKPVHEGLGAGTCDAGPLDRWRRNRSAAAVTGAFMAIKRDVFDEAGGFDAANFAIGCNDIDFCLRVREAGRLILYAADLELMHWESRSRGHDDTADRLRRAQSEIAALSLIWGDDTLRDPSRNPHWVNHETALYHGFRQPCLAQVEDWIRMSVDPWRVVRSRT